MYEKDFLRGYELRNWNFSARIYKIVAIAAIANLLAVFLFAQTNLLTKKGCDSPFVSTICQVLDTVYLSKVLLGTDSEYADAAYNPTEIGENDEITFIDVSSQNLPLSYPEGYFPLASPDQYMTTPEGELVRKSEFEVMNNNPLPIDTYKPTPIPTPYSPPIASGSNPGSLMSKTPKYNKRTPKISGLPDSSSSDATDDSDTDPKDKTEVADNKKPEEKVDVKTATNSDPVKTVEFNKRPVRVWGDNIVASYSGDNNRRKALEQSFKVKLDGVLSKKVVKIADGSGNEVEKEVVVLDSEKSEWIKLKKEEIGNEQMAEIAKQAVEAVGDTGVLGYLYNIGVKNIDITMQQTDDQILITIESEQISSDRAKSVASLAALFIKGAPSLTTEKDLQDLLSGDVSTKADGKMAIINFKVDKKVAQEMIGRRLDAEAQKKKNSENNNVGKTAVNNSQVGK